MRRFLNFLFIYAIVIFGLTANVEAQSGRTFYIDTAGSNSNTGTKVSPWKSAPGMQTASGCSGTGSGPTYTPQAGDHFIFKGGDTWPSACFGMTLSIAGTSASTVFGAGAAPTINGATYYGVDVTWFTGGSFTKPIFDAGGNVPTGDNGAIIIVIANNVTLDDIETAHNQITGGSTCDTATINLGTTLGVVLDRMFIHDWTISNINNTGGHAAGSVCETVGSGSYNDNVYNTEMSDKNTTASMPIGACWIGLGEVAYTNCHDTAEGGLFTEGTFHDNQIHDLDGSPAYANTSPLIHSNGYESDGWPPPFYNNLMYNLNIDYNVLCFSGRGTYFYNNVIYASKVADMAFDTSPGDGCASSTTVQTFIYNNTLEGGSYYTGSSAPIRLVGPAARPGTVTGHITITNNIYIGNSPSLSDVTTPPTTVDDYQMGNPEAAAHGFVPANKFSPSSSDPNTSGQGANLTSSCSGNLAVLCQDTSGAPWFGGAPKTRPTGSTGWDLGAFQGQGGGGGPPAISISSPSPGTISGSVNLQATCTPVSPATCSSVQYTIDGFSFGAAQTSSPYTLAWNTTTAANTNHMIGATATDSNGQTGTAGTVNVTVSNSTPGCFTSTDNGTGPLSWTANQAFTAQSANFTATVVLTPNTATISQDSVFALSQAAMNAYTQGAALIRFNGGQTDSSGFTGNIDVYKGSVSAYAADSLVTFAANTAYTFTITVNFTGPNAGTYTVAETSPSSIAIATNYAFRSTASISSLGFVNAISDNTTPDTAKVCNFQVGAGTSLSFSPSSLNFGNVTVSSGTPTLTIGVTSAGGSTTFSSVGISGDASFTINSNGCTGSQTSCSTVIKFAPTTTGLKSATVTYTDSATGSPQTVNVSGTGIAAASSATPSPTSVNFGNVQLHTNSTSGPIIVALANGPVTFTSVTHSNPDFANASNTCTGSVAVPSCQTTVTFTPSSLTNETDTMTYTDNAPSGGSTQTVSLVGTGVNFPTPAPATQFVWNGTIPIQLSAKGKSVNMDYPITCNCTYANQAWGCACN